MHESLILLDPKFPNTKKENIYWHGKNYFNIKCSKPEISGWYEILVDVFSPYKKLIEMKTFIPILYYDAENDKWIHMNNTIDLSSLEIIGWRLYE